MGFLYLFAVMDNILVCIKYWCIDSPEDRGIPPKCAAVNKDIYYCVLLRCSAQHRNLDAKCNSKIPDTERFYCICRQD